MKIQKFEYGLKYGPLPLFFDLLPPVFAVLVNTGMAGYGIYMVRDCADDIARYAYALLISAGIVFGIVYLYEIAESLITGSNRMVRMENCDDGFLIRFGCRCHYFQRKDVVAIDYDTERNKLMFFLSRCVEKRRGVCSYIRLFSKTGVKSAFSPVSDYLAPLVVGGLDALKFGVPDQTAFGMLSPFAWAPVTNIQMIERRGTFQFAVPCDTVQDAYGIVSRILKNADVSSLFSDL